MLNNQITVFILVVFFSLNFIETTTAKGLTAEAVLGDYKSDPLFGEAAAQKSIIIEVGDLRIAPQDIKIETHLNVRFVFTNSSVQTHLMIMASKLDEVLSDQALIDSYLEHGTAEVNVPGGHSHANSSSDDASPMVKLADEHPAVLLKPGDTKEVLVRFNDTESIQFACVLDQHHKQGMQGVILPFNKSK